jgi:hypothetical protein
MELAYLLLTSALLIGYACCAPQTYEIIGMIKRGFIRTFRRGGK